MTLVGYKASNHPQQTGKRGARDDVDDRGTDQAFFDSLSERFGGFTLDVATPLPVEGIGLLAPPAAVHQLPMQVAHFHLTREERRACEAEHATIRARWDALNRPHA